MNLDDLILDYLDGGDPAPLDAALRRDPTAGRRVAELALQESLLADLGAERVTARRRVPAPRRSPLPYVAAAAVLAFAALVFLALPKKQEPVAPVVRSTPPPVAPVPPPAPRPEPPAPERLAPLPAPPKPDRYEPDSQVRIAQRYEGDSQVRIAPPQPPRPAPEKTVEAAPRPVPLRIADIRGALFRGTARLERDAEVAPSETVSTRHRAAASFRTDGVAVALDRGASLSFEHLESGHTRATLTVGTAFFEVARRPAPFIVATPHGEAAVLGTAFQLEVDDRRALLQVLEGSVRLKNDRGEALVAAGQRSIARKSEKPATPAKADVGLATAWRLPPPEGPWLESEQGRRFPGLAIAAPYGEGEPNADRLARAVAERLDAGLVVGHRHRDAAARRWINLDRGMEGDVRDDGSVGGERFSDAARKATAEYLGRLRSAAGVREAVPFIVQLRDHNLADLDACEVALAGFPRAAVQQAKAFYAQLLEKHRPAQRLTMLFQGVDDAKRPLAFPEDDARIEGYMAPRNARSAAAFFLPPSFGRRAENVDDYAKILGELIEFLNARRR